MVGEKIRADDGNSLIPVTPWSHGGTSTTSLLLTSIKLFQVSEKLQDTGEKANSCPGT